MTGHHPPPGALDSSQRLVLLWDEESVLGTRYPGFWNSDCSVTFPLLPTVEIGEGNK